MSETDKRLENYHKLEQLIESFFVKATELEIPISEIKRIPELLRRTIDDEIHRQNRKNLFRYHIVD